MDSDTAIVLVVGAGIILGVLGYLSYLAFMQQTGQGNVGMSLRMTPGQYFGGMK